MKKAILASILILVLGIPAFCQGTSFLDLRKEANTEYQEGGYLGAKIAIMRAEAVLNMEIADHLGKGEIAFGVFRAALDELSDAQFKGWASDLSGKKVSWEGWMLDAEKKWYGEYEIQLDMDQPEISDGLHDVSIWVGREKEDFVISLSKGDPIRFQGEISKINKVSGRLVVTIKDTEFQE